VNDLDEYMELIVEPTFDDYFKNAHSVRHAYLTCLVIYHAVDRAAYPDDARTLADQWISESSAFSLVDEVAQHFKHGTRRWVKREKAKDPDAMLITNPLGLDGDLKDLELRSLYFQIRDAVMFLRKKTKK
jgi:hypothetical protein